MMAFISDVHGNYEALSAVLYEIDRYNISEIFCLGDVVGYYSQVNECCNELRKRDVKCVMGNHDWYLTTGGMCPRSQSVNDCLEYQRSVITPTNRDWVKSFPVIRSMNNISMVHGGWINPIDEYLEPNERYFEHLDAEIFISGHTHVQKIFEHNGKIYCNPGAVGQPRDGDNRAAFALLDGKKFYLGRVKYDYKKVGTLMKRAGFEEYYYGCLRDASRNLHR